MTNPTSRTIDYRPSAAASRADRDTSLAALQALEEALAGPAPGRSGPWLQRVMSALDALVTSLSIQGATDGESTSIMSEIARNEPRLVPRIERLRQEYNDIGVALRSLRDQIAPSSSAGEQGRPEIDVADIRDRLSAVARRYRQHRSREADLVYEATHVDLGLGG